MTRRNNNVLTQLMPFYNGFKEPWAQHCLTVAKVASKIAANIKGLNPRYAFMYGLVHDIGRTTSRSHKDPRFHCVDGYLILNCLENKARREFNYKRALLYGQLKYSPLTHSFPDLNDLSLVPGYYNPLWDRKLKCRERYMAAGIWDTFIPDKLEGYAGNLYDTIVCLADLMSASSIAVPIEKRLEMVEERYGNTPKDLEIYMAIQKDVSHVEHLAGRTLYEMIFPDGLSP